LHPDLKLHLLIVGREHDDRMRIYFAYAKNVSTASEAMPKNGRSTLDR